MNYLPYQPSYSQLSPEEEALLDEVVAGIRETVSHLDELNGRKTRNFHAKTHAGILGTLTFNETGTALDALNPYPAKELNVLGRFSNAESVILDDRKSMAAFGFALQITDGQGFEADFPLVNFPIFPTNSAEDVLKVVKAINERTRKSEKNEIKLWSTLELVKEFSSLALNSGLLSMMNVMLKSLMMKKDFVLNYTFHSVGCYRFGDAMSKIRLVPQKKYPVEDAAERVQQEMVQEILLQESICFDFQIQVSTDEKKQPINELLVEWPEDQFVTIGRLEFPKQEIITSGNQELEHTSFSPFQNAEGLLPVGKIQQLRHCAYDASFEARTGKKMDK